MAAPRPPIAQPAPADGACCDACAAVAEQPSSAVPVRPATAVVPPDLIVLEPDRQRSVSRAADRRITLAGLVISAGFLVAAVVTATLPESVRHGLWLPVHLGLAGTAGTAVASVLPFFVATLSIAQPADWRLRGGAIALIAGGALAASAGVAGLGQTMAVAGAVAYLAGLAAVAVAAFWPLRDRRGPRRLLVLGAYGAAIALGAVGVALVGMMLSGFAPVVERWGLLKPAHAWLNVFGFLSVVVAATLVHLAPTVEGSRIRPRRSAVVALGGLVVGAPLVALGFALGDDRVARLGATAELLGAVALVAHALGVHRDRGHWTTDRAWHRLVAWSLLLAPGWFLVAVVLAAGRILWLGAVPAAWSLLAVAAPLAVGWLVQVLIGAWSQLVPAIGPGDIAAHARQRTSLGRASTVRLVALNIGVALVTLGMGIEWTPGTVVGGVIAGAAVVTALALFLEAVWTGRADDLARPASPARQTG